MGKERNYMYNRDLFKKGNTVYSFEVFPPKTTSGIDSITGVMSELLAMQPDYMSVTYGAGGSVKDNRTVEICKMIKAKSAVPPVAHMTCVGAKKADIDILLNELDKAGVDNILALRGDGAVNGVTGGDFTYASDLANYIKARYGERFCIGGACYPVGHIESANLDVDMDNLKKKVDSGVEYLTTQLFFDNDEVYRFLERAEKVHLNVPITCGIMPLTNSKQIERMVTMSGATIPAKLSRLIARYVDSAECMREAGLLYATEQIVDLLASGVDGVHLYTMNNPYVAGKITANISGLLKR